MANHCKVYKNPNLKIEGSTVSWENEIIQIDHISHLWSGAIPKDLLPVRSFLVLPFIALASYRLITLIVMLLLFAVFISEYAWRSFAGQKVKGLNIELNTGRVYSFISDNEETSDKAYKLLSGLLTNRDPYANYQISFLAGTIIDTSEKELLEEPEAEPVAEPVKIKDAYEPKSPIGIELQKLCGAYREKEEVDEDIVALIENAIQFAEKNDRENMKITFVEFIKKGLIYECNNLGLNLLLGEIRSCIY